MPLVLTIGPPGSGKSTWAQETFGPKWLNIQRDRLRTAIFGGKRAYFDHPFQPGQRSRVITACMRQAIASWPNSKVVCSDTNLWWSTTQPIFEMFDKVHLVLFDITEDEFYKRNEQRPTDDIVPRGDMVSFWNAYVDKDAWFRKYKLVKPEELEL